MMLLVGTFLGTTDRNREWEGRRWVETTAHVLVGMNTVNVTLFGGTREGTGAFDKSTLPASGEVVMLDVYGRGAADKRVYLTATSVVSESALAEQLSAGSPVAV